MVSSTFHAENVWKTLSRATADKKHPWRVVGLSTSGLDGVNSRNIILRAVEFQDALLTFYTDLRSGKIADIAHDPKVSLLFWNPRSNEQLRAWGIARVLDDSALLNKHWARIPDYSKQDYASLSAPGAALEEGAGIDLDTAQHNFRVIQVQIQRMDYLKLDREGHQRHGLSWVDGVWQGHALVP